MAYRHNNNWEPCTGVLIAYPSVGGHNPAVDGGATAARRTRASPPTPAAARRSSNHSVADFTSFFGDLALVLPGVTDAREWHPDPGEEAPFPPHSGYAIAGVVRVA